MSIELSVGSSQGRPAEWHDTIQPDGTRLTVCPNNADMALAFRNEHWVGDLSMSDADKFNEIFAPSVAAFNAKQKVLCRKMGPESTNPDRQKSYYDGIMDGTFCMGAGELQEKPVEEVVLQLGNKDDNGTTDADFSMKHWYALKQSGREDEASRYALEHLNDSETAERTKRILRRAVDRIVAMDPEHLVVLRADFHGDEPCGTPNVHLAFTFRATGYKKGMTERVASVKALKQMGFVKQKDTEFGIVQLHERFRDIIEEEMAADAAEYGYEPIKRKAPSGEQHKRTDVDVFREMAAEKSELAVREAMQKDREEIVEDRIKRSNSLSAGVAKREKAVEREEARQKETAAQQDEQRRYLMQAYDAMIRLLNQMGDERTEFDSWDEFSDAFQSAAMNYAADVEAEARSAARADVENEKKLYVSARAIFEARLSHMEQVPEPFRAWAEKTKMAYRSSEGKAELHTVSEWWRQHVEKIRQGAVKKPEQKEIIRQADKGLGE